MISVLTPSIRPQYLDITQKCLEAQTYWNFEWLVEVGLPHKDGFDLPKAYNRMLRRANGDVLVFLQDCITIPPDALEAIRWLDHGQTAYTYPVGKQSGSGIKWDWRRHGSEPRSTSSITPNHWEIDLASAPRALFGEIGGFDEEFCKGWSWDNVEVGWRAEAAGYHFEVSTITRGIALDHDAIAPHPFRSALEPNAARANETRKRAERGQYKLPYLSLY